MEKNALRGYDSLFWFMDGDATVIVREDFIDLQESPAVFLECPFCKSGNIIPPAQKYPVFSCDDCGGDYVPDLSAVSLDRHT